ncbi:type II toxin-antitoxin system Phd/YefM family antitoxin [Sulfitobacter sp. S190]|uniref:type II toxin-antitoxin system Phd/YefM family antitoxin n=1 Tax=Sulfitobacter sp. S190 TaxID=2867022 RepID=UPI0021A3C496|nr:type II toxin-antitoxin system Phd/YefM family antitoxin [Sulfitobacter sp. S190]UWR24636.1 type II toxin-antitoxin system Phd/YefM family antitoxin [Sulfitobacter sp. S190]
MKQFAAGELTRNTGDLFEAATVAPVAITKHRKPRFVIMSMEQFEALTDGQQSQVALETGDMPEELGKLLDKGLEDHFRDH